MPRSLRLFPFKLSQSHLQSSFLRALYRGWRFSTFGRAHAKKEVQFEAKWFYAFPDTSRTGVRSWLFPDLVFQIDVTHRIREGAWVSLPSFVSIFLPEKLFCKIPLVTVLSKVKVDSSQADERFLTWSDSMPLGKSRLERSNLWSKS